MYTAPAREYARRNRVIRRRRARPRPGDRRGHLRSRPTSADCSPSPCSTTSSPTTSPSSTRCTSRASSCRRPPAAATGLVAGHGCCRSPSPARRPRSACSRSRCSTATSAAASTATCGRCRGRSSHPLLGRAVETTEHRHRGDPLYHRRPGAPHPELEPAPHLPPARAALGDDGRRPLRRPGRRAHRRPLRTAQPPSTSTAAPTSRRSPTARSTAKRNGPARSRSTETTTMNASSVGSSASTRCRAEGLVIEALISRTELGNEITRARRRRRARRIGVVRRARRWRRNGSTTAAVAVSAKRSSATTSP